MVDDSRRQATERKEGSPRSLDDAEIKLPDAIPGALAENSSERSDEFGVPRGKGEVRMPEATEDALREDKE